LDKEDTWRTVESRNGREGIVSHPTTSVFSGLRRTNRVLMRLRRIPRATLDRNIGSESISNPRLKIFLPNGLIRSGLVRSVAAETGWLTPRARLFPGFQLATLDLLRGEEHLGLRKSGSAEWPGISGGGGRFFPVSSFCRFTGLCPRLPCVAAAKHRGRNTEIGDRHRTSGVWLPPPRGKAMANTPGFRPCLRMGIKLLH
jgi:hypothetical protein